MAHVKNDSSSFLKVHFSHTQGTCALAFVSLIVYVGSSSVLAAGFVSFVEFDSILCFTDSLKFTSLEVAS